MATRYDTIRQMARQRLAKPERVLWVDYAKGLCIILVVMMHSTLGVGEAMGGTGFLHEVVAFARPFRMPDFFFISGLFVARVIDRDWSTYLDRKVLHFVWFYVLWVAIQAAFKLPPALLHGDWAALAPFAMAWIEPFGTLWFIYLLPVFFVASKALRGVPVPVLLAVAAALQIAHIETGWTLVDEFAGRWVYFLLGATFADRVFAYADRVAARPLAALGLLAAWAVVNGLAVKTASPVAGFTSVAALPGIGLVLGIVGALAVVTVSALLARVGMARFVAACGRNSLAIYLAFFLPMAATRALLVKSGLIADVGVVSALVTAAGVIAPLLLQRAVAGTALDFLFVRPAWATLGRRPARLQAAS
ncbi:acyltransferase family protein [Alsobacter sp. R-9]